MSVPFKRISLIQKQIFPPFKNHLFNLPKVNWLFQSKLLITSVSQDRHNFDFLEPLT